MYVGSGELRLSADHRLAFRELGLAIGLYAAQRMSVAGLRTYVGLGTQIEEFWLSRANQRATTWREHRNINEVMLATSLAPEGYLGAT